MSSRVRRARLKIRDGDYLHITVQAGFIEFQHSRGGVNTYCTLPRDVAFKLLKWLVPAVKQMPASVDPVATMREWAEIDDAQRQSRRERRRSPKRRTKRYRSG